MATLEDLQDVLISVDISMKEQTGILKSMLLLQESEALLNEAERQRNAAGRTEAPPAPPLPRPEPGQPTPPESTAANNSLSGLLGGLTALFGSKMLGKFAVLATSAAALAITVGATIGTLSGQMKAISTYFKLFGVDFPKIFDNFKNSISLRFMQIIDDLKIRAAFIRVDIADAFKNFTNSIKNLFPSTPDSAFSKIITSIKDKLNILIEPFKKALTTLEELSGRNGSPSRIANFLDTIRKWFGEIGSRISRIAGVVGRIFAPIAVIMTAWETIKGALDGYAENGILGGFQGAIDGFFTSLVTIPLDLIKSMVAWVTDKLGFDETAEAMRSFSFTDLWKQMTGAIFNGIRSAIDWVRGIFTWSDSDPDAPSFSLSEYISGVIATLKEKFAGFGAYLASLPEKISIEAQSMWIDAKEKLKLGFLDLADWLTSIPKKMLAMVMDIMGAVKFTVPDWVPRIGGRTIGLVDQEDVAAANRAASQPNSEIEERRAAILEDSANQRRILEERLRQIEDRAIEGQNTIALNYAPIDARQTQINQKGGDSQTAINSFGHRNRHELSYGSVPGGLQSF
jgi:hypothetical protein